MEHEAPPIPLDELLGHRAWVRSLARSLVRDAATADDVAQDAWLAAIRRPPSERSTVRAWFATVVRNRAREKGRAAARVTRRESAVARPEYVEATVDVVARGESHKRVVMAVMDLEEPYRTTLLLRFFEDLPPRDVATRMGCPVETVRTRTKRALARLRERLGDDARDGVAWRATILPLLGGPAQNTAHRRTGDRKMLPLQIAAVAALLLAIPTTYVLLDAGDPPRAPVDDSTSAQPPGSAGAPRPGPGRDRVANAPPVSSPEDPVDEGGEKASEDDGWQTFPPPTPLPADEDASVFENGELAMRVSVEPPHPRAGEPFHLVVTFRNDGTGPLRFHVPEHTGLVPFPRLELRGADGKVRMPVPASFQSMWQHGLQGEIVRLEPGEERAVKTMIGGVAEVPDDPARRDTGRFAHSQKRLALQPGDYAVTAILAKKHPTVPWGEPNFGRAEKEVPGLWTGEVRSTPITIRLAPPDDPLLTLRAPETLVPGEDMTLTLEIANPSQEDKELRGTFAMRRAQKGGPSYVAWFELGDVAVPTTPDHTRIRTLPAGETRTCRIDLGALVWERVGNRRHFMGKEPWPFARAYPALWVTCGERDADGAGMIGSNTAFRPLEAAPDLASRGLSLRVEPDGLTTADPYVVVHLRNAGATEAAVPRTLRTPHRLALSLRPQGKRSRPVSIDVLATDEAGPLLPADVVSLAPGEELHARVPVARDWAAQVPEATYDLRAHWMSLDSGDRDGFATGPLVGRLTSDPVEVTVAPR